MSRCVKKHSQHGICFLYLHEKGQLKVLLGWGCIVPFLFVFLFSVFCVIVPLFISFSFFVWLSLIPETSLCNVVFIFIYGRFFLFVFFLGDNT